VCELKHINFLEFASGLYKKGIELLDPENDDILIISGCILLLIGFEKLLKEALVLKNPLMILENIKFQDVVDQASDVSILNKRTVSCEEAFSRLTIIFPQLDQEKHLVKKLIDSRNFFIHSAGHFDLKTIESNVRVNITAITKIICELCLNKDPYQLFGVQEWQSMIDYKDAYMDAEILELKKRISFLKRNYSEGDKLPCIPIKRSTISYYYNYTCPICDQEAEIEIDIDIEYDHRDETILGAWPYPKYLYCENCGFSLTEAQEIEYLVGERALKEMLYPEHDVY